MNVSIVTVVTETPDNTHIEVAVPRGGDLCAVILPSGQQAFILYPRNAMPAEVVSRVLVNDEPVYQRPSP